MKTCFKRVLALLLAAVLLLGIFAGCAADPKNAELEQLGNVEEKKKGNKENSNKTENKPSTSTDKDTNKDSDKGSSAQQSGVSDALTVQDGEEVKYVLIYNPRVYIDDDNTGMRRTGDISARSRST